MTYTSEEFARVVSALYPPEVAESMIEEHLAARNEGWGGFVPLIGRLGLGLAALNESVAELIIQTEPAVEQRVRELQRDPEAGLRALAQKREPRISPGK